MANKLPLKDVLGAIDLGGKTVWDELDDEQKKSVSFYLLNRYASVVKGNREAQELTVFKTNEYYNKHYFTLAKHQKLLWQLLCMTQSSEKKIQYHEWIGYKKKGGTSNSKVAKELEKIYPNMKEDEIQMLVSLNKKKDLEKFIEEYHGKN
jgi:hypothetical protein